MWVQDLRARVQPGHRLAVVDVSAAGALVEAACQLRPGSVVVIHLEHENIRHRVSALVTRCVVAAIDPIHGIRYRAALCFSECCEWVRETATREG